ncbi:MAG: hypothetical protein KGL90_03255 [Burkholderiales bacterium]|nr:hypothetical protein [Burkholderiales bacterium]
MIRSLNVRGLVGVVGGAVLMVCASAQAATVLNPGLWKSEYRVLVNGADSTVLLSQAQAQLAVALPSQFKQGQTLSLNAAGTRGTASFCLSPASATSINSPTALFTSLSKMNPGCRLVPSLNKATATSLPFTGRCDDPTSFTGNVRGTVKVSSASTWTADFSGVGRIPDAALTAMKMPTGINVQVQSLSTSTFASATCP